MASSEYSMNVGSLAWTILISTALSNAAIDLSGQIPVGIIMPAAWDAANLTFQASIDNVTFNNVYDEAGTEYTITAAAARHILLLPTKLQAARYLKLRSGTAGVPVNQTAQRTVTLVTRFP